MKHHLPHLKQATISPLVLAPFHTVQTRALSDGWTPMRQAELTGHLAKALSVTTAAREKVMKASKRGWKVALDCGVGAGGERSQLSLG